MNSFNANFNPSQPQQLNFNAGQQMPQSFTQGQQVPANGTYSFGAPQTQTSSYPVQPAPTFTNTAPQPMQMQQAPQVQTFTNSAPQLEPDRLTIDIHGKPSDPNMQINVSKSGSYKNLQLPANSGDLVTQIVNGLKSLCKKILSFGGALANPMSFLMNMPAPPGKAAGPATDLMGSMLASMLADGVNKN